jgi:hypothetical protein
MPQSDRSAGFAPGTVGLQSERVHVVILSAADIKIFAIRIKSDSGKSIRHRQRLFLRRRTAGDVENENILSDIFSFLTLPSQKIVPAGESQQCPLIRTDYRGYPASGNEGWEISETRVQPIEMRTRCGQRRDCLSSWQDFGFHRWLPVIAQHRKRNAEKKNIPGSCKETASHLGLHGPGKSYRKMRNRKQRHFG